MKNVSAWSRVVLRFSPRWAYVAVAVCLAAALTPASALAQAGVTVINSYNGSGSTLRAYITSILNQNKLADGVANAPHQNFWEKLDY
jgi:hypothetical protein